MIAAFFKRHKLICINASLSELTGGLHSSCLQDYLAFLLGGRGGGGGRSKEKDNLMRQMERGTECSVHHPKINDGSVGFFKM